MDNYQHNFVRNSHTFDVTNTRFYVVINLIDERQRYIVYRLCIFNKTLFQVFRIVLCSALSMTKVR